MIVPKKISIDVILNITFSFFLFNVIFKLLLYYFYVELGSNTMINLSFNLAYIIFMIIIGYYFIKNELFLNRSILNNLLLSLLMCCILNNFFEIFIHHYLDTTFKETIAEINFAEYKVKIAEVQRSKNVTFDNINEQSFVDNIIGKYSIKNILKNLIVAIPGYLFFAFILSYLYPTVFSIKNENIRKNQNDIPFQSF